MTASNNKKASVVLFVALLVVISILGIVNYQMHGDKTKSYSYYMFPSGTDTVYLTVVPGEKSVIPLGTVASPSIYNLNALIEVQTPRITPFRRQIIDVGSENITDINALKIDKKTFLGICIKNEYLRVLDTSTNILTTVDVEAIALAHLDDKFVVLSIDGRLYEISPGSMVTQQKTKIPTFNKIQNCVMASAKDNGEVAIALRYKNSMNILVYRYTKNALENVATITPPAMVNDINMEYFDDGCLYLVLSYKTTDVDIFRIKDKIIDEKTVTCNSTVDDAVVDDIDGDGVIDLALLSRSSGKISIYFDAINPIEGQRVYMGGQIMTFCFGDLNGDRFKDIIATDNDGGSVNIRISTFGGNGVFYGEMMPCTVGSYPYTIALADFDADGDCDIATAVKGLSAIAIVYNNGLGKFAPYIVKDVGYLPRYVELGDLNNDGFLDIVSSDFGSESVTVLINAGNGMDFNRYDFQVGDQPRGLYIGDLNGNGYEDIAVANFRSYTLSIIKDPWLKIKDDLTLKDDGQYDVGDGPRGIWGGDFDNDGDIDIVTADASGHTMTMLKNNGNGDFSFWRIYNLSIKGKSPRGITTADFNTDGWIDLALSLYKSHKVLVIINKKGEFDIENASTYDVGKGPRSLTVYDLNNDGAIDIVSVDSKNDTVTALINNGDGTFNRIGSYAVGENPHCIRVADMDGDGYGDIVTANENENTITIVYNNGLRFNKSEWRVCGFKPRWLALGDLNNDGLNDTIVAAYAQNAVTIDLFAAKTTIDVSGLKILHGIPVLHEGIVDVSEYIFIEDNTIKLAFNSQRAVTISISIKTLEARVEV